jgi:serine/threonine-protein kinase
MRGIRVTRLALAAAALVAAGPGGCATCAPYQRVGVESVPPGAQVFADGEPVGTTPMELTLSTGVEHAVFVKKQGYRPELVVMQRNVPEDPPPFLTPADVRVWLTRMSPRPGAAAADPTDPNAPVPDPADDPLGRDLEVDIDD